jgi:hypothetical protein
MGGWVGQVLRRAAVATGNSTYEEAACKVMKRAGQEDAYLDSPLNLLIPPHHSFEASTC